MALSSRSVLLAAGWLAFAAALPMEAVDTNMGGELLRGFGTRGYQCLVGAFLAPLGLPLATPLWLVVCAGNLTALLSPGRARSTAFARWARIVMPLAAAGAWSIARLGPLVGVAGLYPGYFMWATALTLIALAFSIVSPRTSRPLRR